MMSSTILAFPILLFHQYQLWVIMHITFGRKNKVPPPLQRGPHPHTHNLLIYYFTRQKGFCNHDLVEDLAMERWPWCIQVTLIYHIVTESLHEGSRRVRVREGNALTQQRSKRQRDVRRLCCCFWRWRKGPWAKGCRQPFKAGKVLTSRTVM